ncbi:hypothetical protein GOD90_10420 [Sinorhizobium medicae]|nr:hypothetical protein [Sinorhizobium medicae]
MNLTTEQLEERVAAYKSYGSQRLAAQALGIGKSTMGDSLKVAAERGLLGTDPVLPGYAIKSIASKTADGAWVKQTKAAGEVFEVPAGHTVKGVSALVDADGRVIQSWQKTSREDDRGLSLSAAIKDEFSQYKGYAKLVPPPAETYADLCTYYPIVDPHIGMLAHWQETGESNDLKIGTGRVGGTLQKLIGRSPESETAVIINTGDFFHADDQRNVTPASGHQLDVDGRDHKVKWAGVNLLRSTIDLALQKHKKVVVKNLKGNHDPESAKWLNISLGMFYWNEPRVEIDPEDGNNDHFFHLFGVNYTGATHGHTMKPDRMYVMMAEDNPDYWNASLYRWCIFGHIHHETKKQIGSLICESFSQPVPKDAYAHSHGYRSGSAMQSVTLHAQDGESDRVIVRFPPVRPTRTAANDNVPQAKAA